MGLLAVFNMVDNDILLQRLQTASALAVLPSTGSSRTQYVWRVQPDRPLFGWYVVFHRAPCSGQSSADLVSLIQHHCLLPHLYADDNQNYGACGRFDVSTLLQTTTGFLTAVADWMSSSRLELNSDKTRVHVAYLSSESSLTTYFWSSDRLHSGFTICCSQWSWHFHHSRSDSEDPCTMESVSLLCNLALFMKHLSLHTFVCLPFPCFCICPQQSRASHSHPASPVSTNSAARRIFNLRRCDHITDALTSLHWLCVPERIIQVGNADISCTAWLYTTLLGVVIHMCHRHAAPTLRFRTYMAFPSTLLTAEKLAVM